jgi:uncharacterized membrane protein YqjE
MSFARRAKPARVQWASASFGNEVDNGGERMEKLDRKKSVLRLYIELYEKFAVLVYMELKLALLEIKENIHSVENGFGLLAVGAFLMVFAFMALIGTAVAALAVVLQVWAAALVVTLVLSFFGAAFLFTGLAKMKGFTLLPVETLRRFHEVMEKLKKHYDQPGQ